MESRAPRPTHAGAEQGPEGLRPARRTYQPGWFYYFGILVTPLIVWARLPLSQGDWPQVLWVPCAAGAVLFLVSWQSVRVDDAGMHVRSLFKWFTIRWEEIGGFSGRTLGGMHDEFDEGGTRMFRLYVRGTHGHVIYKAAPWITHQPEMRRLGRAYMARAGHPYHPPA